MNIEVIVDFCGRDSLLGENVDYTAEYFLSEKVVRFSGMWQGVPEMPTLQSPTENMVYGWVRQNPNWYEKKRQAENDRQLQHDARMDLLDEIYKTHGQNHIKIVYLLPDKTESVHDCCCGIRSQKEMQECARYNLSRYPSGTKIKQFKFIQRIPDKESKKYYENYTSSHLANGRYS